MTYESLLKSLDPHQVKAILAEDCLVMAGPGSGKTRTLIAKALKEIKAGKRVYIVTFTVAAAEEIKERLAQFGGRPKKIGTLHSMCLDIMHECGLYFELADETAMEALAVQVGQQIRSRRTEISNHRAKELLDGDLPKAVKEKVFVKAMQNAMEEAGLVSYAGMLHAAVACLTSNRMIHREGPETVYLVDEAQDSGPIDLAIYDQLRKSGAHLWMVGDLQQAIFSFRHQQKVDVWKWWGDREVLMLPDNYRSGVAVVKALNLINAKFVPRVEITSRKKVEGAVGVIKSDYEGEMLEAVRDRVKDLDPKEVAVLCRMNFEVAKVGTFLESCGISVKRRKKDLVRVPEKLWAALSCFIKPEADWRALRYLRSTGMAEEQVAAHQQEAGVQMRPVIADVFPELLKEGQEWSQWMHRMGVPRNEQSWFYDRAGEDWQERPWDEILLRLYETAVEPEEGQGVTVTTVHGAKGREWAHVLMLWTDVMSYKEKDGAEEERIFFVGASRAIETLTFYWCEKRTGLYVNAPIEVEPCKSLKTLMHWHATL